MIRSRGSVPIAENMLAYLAICSAFFLFEISIIFRCLQKYGFMSSYSNLWWLRANIARNLKRRFRRKKGRPADLWRTGVWRIIKP
jgi:hypothetical protein